MAAADVDMDELFGISDGEDDAPKQQPQQEEGAAGEDDDVAQERAAQKNSVRRRATGEPLHVELPVPAAKMGTADTMMIRLSNIVTVKHRPFDPESHNTEVEVVRDAAGNEQFKPLDLNVIRWRFGRNELGEETIESNARLVRFSDGSVQLEIGDEVLKVAEADVAADNDFLAVQHGGGLLECKAHLRRKLTCRPSSLNSKSHKLLTSHVDRRHVKEVKTKRTVTTIDPEHELEIRRKEIERDERDRLAMERKQKKEVLRYASASRGRRASPQRDRDELDVAFLEGDDGGRSKKASKKGGAGRKRERYASDEDSGEDSDQSYSEEEEKKPSKKSKKKAGGDRRIESSDDD